MTPDIDAIRHIVAESYRGISGPAGARDWQHHASCFTGDASLRVIRHDNGGSRIETMSLAEYAASRGPFFERQAFFETEVYSDVLVSGDVAHSMSTYESRWALADPPFETGVNSIQLVRLNGEWRIVSIAWVAGSAAKLIRN